jgi:uncharacterized protein YegP (UPF0339 family)
MKFHVYKDRRNEYRWRLIAANGKILADSAEGYTTKQSCKDGIELVKGTTNAPVIDDD